MPSGLKKLFGRDKKEKEKVKVERNQPPNFQGSSASPVPSTGTYQQSRSVQSNIPRQQPRPQASPFSYEALHDARDDSPAAVRTRFALLASAVTGGVQEQQNLNRPIAAIDVDHNAKFRYSNAAPYWYVKQPPPYPKAEGGYYLCETCRRIDIYQCFLRTKADVHMGLREYVYFGQMSDLMKRNECNLCVLIMDAIKHSAKTKLDIIQNSQKRDLRFMYGQDSFAESAHFFLTPFRHDNTTAEFRLVSIADEALASQDMFIERTTRSSRTMGIQLMVDVRGSGRAVTPDRIDYAWIKERIKLCDGSMRNMRIDPPSGLRVIDVVRGYVLDLPPGRRFVTLSYKWSEMGQLMLTKETEPMLTAQYGLMRNMEQVPKTIQDAITLVSYLDEEYLWVDALCIRQDDEADKMDQIAKMGSVYKQSVLTIVAACGHDADYGLPGVRSGTRQLKQWLCPLMLDVPNEKIMTVIACTLLPDDEIIHTTVWKTRGWTMQERCLARKTLYVTDYGVMFECRHGMMLEDRHCYHPNPPEPDEHVDSKMFWFDDYHPRVTKRIPTQSNFDKYAFMVSDYTRRNLTYQTDAEKAFMGVLSNLTHFFRGQFYHGLPPTELEAALLWTPIGSSVRRVDAKTGRPLFPSWSWLGWIGHAAYPWMIEREFAFSTQNSPLQVRGWGHDADDWRPLDAFRESHYFQQWSRDPEDDWLCIEVLRNDAQRTLRPLPPMNSDARAYFTVPDPQGLGTLHLRTLSAHFQLNNAEVQKRRSNYNFEHEVLQLQIYDREERAIGYLDIPDLENVEGQQRTWYSGSAELIFISHSALGGMPKDAPPSLDRSTVGNPSPSLSAEALGANLGNLLGGGRGLHPDARFDTLKYNATPGWRMVNVLMVRPVDVVGGGHGGDETSYERLAAGRVHIDAFLGAKPVLRELVLR